MDKNKLTFISYSRVDQKFALRLSEELKSFGFNVWLDQIDIPKGARWDDEIEWALMNCDVFMVILTPYSSNSQNVKDEIGIAVDDKKQVIPILLKQCVIPFRLRRFQYVDFTKMSFQEGFESVKALLAGRIVEPAPPRNWFEVLLMKLASISKVYSIIALIVFAGMGALTWSLLEPENPRSIPDATSTPSNSPTPSPTIVATETLPVVLVEITLPEDTPTVEPSATPLFMPTVIPSAHIQDISLDEMCALVANLDHSILLESGNCMDLPEIP